MRKVILFLAALSLSSQAFAMGTRPVIKSGAVAPMTYVAEGEALQAEYNAFTQCLGDPRFSQIRGTGELAAVEKALLTAKSAGKWGQLDQLNTETALFHSLLGPLKTIYGC